MFILTNISCSNKYESINRDMLSGKSLKFWDYYHSVDYCKRIDIFDSISEFNLKISENEKLLTTEIQGILESQLFKKYPNNQYGNIYFDLENQLDTTCCTEIVYVGGFVGGRWLNNEHPPKFRNIDSLKKLIYLWKVKLNCDSLNTK